MNWRSITYDWSTASLLLFVVLLILWSFFMLYFYRKQKLKLFGTEEVVRQVVEPRSFLSYWSKVSLLSFVWIMGVLALMQPKGNERYVESGGTVNPQKVTYRQQMHTVIFALDVSASMGVKDVIGRSRLDVGKEVVDNIISRLRGQEVALYAFTSEAMQVVPLTADYLFTRMMSRQLQINDGDTYGTDLAQPLQVIVKQYLENHPLIPKTLILLSDGGDTIYESAQSSPSARDKRLEEILSSIKNVEKNNLRVFVVGLGSQAGGVVPNVKYKGEEVLSKLDTATLKPISEKGNGLFFNTEEYTPSQIGGEIIRQINLQGSFEKDLGTGVAGAGNERIYDLYYQYPLGIALVLLALYLFVPDTNKRKSFVNVIPKVFQNLAWILILPTLGFGDSSGMTLAQAYYEAGDYTQAVREYETLLQGNWKQWQKNIIYYDLGTVLLAEGKLNEALSQYDNLVNPIAQPQLMKRMAFNKSLARVLLARNQLKEIESNAEWKIEDITLLIGAFKRSEDSFFDAREADCLLEKAEGAQECSLTADVDNLSKVNQELISRFLNGYKKYEVTISDFSKLPFLELLKRVMIDYEMVLLKDALQKEDQERLSELLGYLGDKASDRDNNFLKQSQSYLEASISDLEKGNIFIAKMWMYASLDALRQYYQLHQADKGPKEILKNTIIEENYALDLNRLWQRANEKEHSSKEINELLQFAQKHTNSLADHFNQAVVDAQTKSFDAKSKNSEAAVIKWDEIIALFMVGQQNAVEALAKLQFSHFEPIEAKIYQQKALDKWNEALEKLHHQEKQAQEEKKSSKASSAETPPPIQKQSSGQAPPPGQSLEAILRLGQEMEEDDRSHPILKNVSSDPGVERPW